MTANNYENTHFMLLWKLWKNSWKLTQGKVKRRMMPVKQIIFKAETENQQLGDLFRA